MGKHTDKLYVTHSEHAGLTGGAHSASSSGYKKKDSVQFASLPFDHCALTLKPFDVPVANAKDGIIYDLLAIVPYLKKHGRDPVTGETLAAGDLVKLNFAKNADDNYHDPLTFRVFTNHTPLVAIKPSGNVYAKDTVDRLNVKAGFWRDLVDDTPFKREDIIVLQDPHNPDHRDLKRFKHLDQDLKPVLEDTEASSISGINVGATGGASALIQTIAAKNAAQKQKTTSPGVGKTDTVTPLASTSTSTSAKVPYNASKASTGRSAASLTSTSAPISTKTERALYDEEELMFDSIKDKGYVKLTTNFGEMNVELFCDKAPRTCYNFLTLAKEGKYDDTVFHRLIPGFMIQGGDYTKGDGTGGESMWGKEFADEYDKRGAHRHDARGLLSMANKGPNTNGSQFFITFRDTPHLNGKHTVFGKLVGGEDTLSNLEKVNVHPGNNKPTRPVRLLDVSVFKNPFDEYQAKLAKRLEREANDEAGAVERKRKREERDADRITWFGHTLESNTSVATGAASLEGLGKVGKYLNKAPVAAGLSAAAPTDSVGLSAAAKKRQKKAGGGFGDFSGCSVMADQGQDLSNGFFDAEKLQAALDVSFAEARSQLVSTWFPDSEIANDASATASTSSSSSQLLHLRPPRLGLGAQPSQKSQTGLVNAKLAKSFTQDASAKKAGVKRSFTETVNAGDSDEGESRASRFTKKNVTSHFDAFRSNKARKLAKQANHMTPPTDGGSSVASTATSTSLASPPPHRPATSYNNVETVDSIPSSSSSAHFPSDDEYMHVALEDEYVSATLEEELQRKGSPERRRVPYAPLFDLDQDDDNDNDNQHTKEAESTPSKPSSANKPLPNSPTDDAASISKKKRRKRKRASTSTLAFDSGVQGVQEA